MRGWTDTWRCGLWSLEIGIHMARDRHCWRCAFLKSGVDLRAKSLTSLRDPIIARNVGRVHDISGTITGAIRQEPYRSLIPASKLSRQRTWRPLELCPRTEHTYVPITWADGWVDNGKRRLSKDLARGFRGGAGDDWCQGKRMGYRGPRVQVSPPLVLTSEYLRLIW